MRFATDWLKSKTTWTAAGALCYALADVAAKGELMWQSALVALVGMLGATLRDTIARQGEEARLELGLATSSLKAASSLHTKTAALAEATRAMVDAAKPSSAEGMTPRRNVAGKVWPTDYPEAMAAATAEPDGEADRHEETHL